MGETTLMGFTSRNPPKLSLWRAKKDPLMILAKGREGISHCEIYLECNPYQRPTIKRKDH